MPTVTKFTVKCPLGHRCHYRDSSLGSYFTPEKALEKLKWHLMKSPYHRLDENEAETQLLEAAIDPYEQPAEDLDSTPEVEEQRKKVKPASQQPKKRSRSPTRSKGRYTTKRSCTRSRSIRRRRPSTRPSSSSKVRVPDDFATQLGKAMGEAMGARPAAAEPQESQLQLQSRTRVATALQAMEAARQSARTAAKMSAMETAAFEAEAKTLEQAILDLRSVLL